jgi:hypothetical protein
MVDPVFKLDATPVAGFDLIALVLTRILPLSLMMFYTLFFSSITGAGPDLHTSIRFLVFPSGPVVTLKNTCQLFEEVRHV